jgi:hypothetical protein
MQLKEDFAYQDPKQHIWLAPKDSVIDGASIPRVFWSLIGGPFEGKYRNASVIHDVACVERKMASDAVHEMFYAACRCGGVSEAQAKAMYFAVSHWGPTWKMVFETKIVKGATVATARGVDVQEAKNPTQGEAEQVFKYFEINNPTLDEIPGLDFARMN